MKKTLFFLTLVVLCWACTLEPDGLYYEEIDSPSHSGSVYLNNYHDKDTISIYNAGAFEYRIVNGQGKIETVQVLLDNSVIFTGTESGTFSLNLDQLRRSPKKIKIQFITTSGTGSLADKAGAEKFQIWREWILAVDISAPPPPVLSLSNENGFMKLTWTGYSKPNFKNYSIELSYDTYQYQSVVLTDSKQNYWIDSSFVGNTNARYRVTTNALQSNWSEYKTWKIDFQELKSSYRPADSTVFLSWRKPTFNGPFKNYRIIENGVERLVANINDTTLSFQLKEVVFRKNAQIFFSVRGKNPLRIPVDISRIITNTANAAILKNYPNELSYNVALNKIIGITSPNAPDRKIYYYNNSMQKQDSLSFDVFSFDYKTGSPYVYYYVQPGYIFQLNLNTKVVIRTVVTRPSTYVSGPSISGAANGVVSYSIMRKTGAVYYSNIKLYNFNTDNTFYDTDFFASSTSSGSYYNLSGQGNFALLNGASIYRINGTMLQLIGTLSGPTYFTRFRDDDENQILARSNANGNLILLNTSDLTVIRTITPPSGYSFSMYDPATHYALFTKINSERVYLINIDTQQMKTIKALTGSTIGYKFVNGFLFAEDGSYLKVL